MIVRRILSQLKAAGLIAVARGTGGLSPTRPLEKITFLDVYRAIEPLENGDLFRFHEGPSPACPVGRNIRPALDGKLRSIQGAMEERMKQFTVGGLCAELEAAIGQERCALTRATENEQGGSENE